MLVTPIQFGLFCIYPCLIFSQSVIYACHPIQFGLFCIYSCLIFSQSVIYAYYSIQFGLFCIYSCLIFSGSVIYACYSIQFGLFCFYPCLIFRMSVTAASYSVSVLDCLSCLRDTLERLLPAWSTLLMNLLRRFPSGNCICQALLSVERNNVRLRQETQLSDTGIAKAFTYTATDWYTGAGNGDVGRSLTTSPARI